jgi:two-component system, LytTR family, response regulator
MIKSIIVDDEEKSRITLGKLLALHCPSVEILTTCESVASAVKAIEAHSPELVFLDIEMPFENGFRLIDKIPNPTFEIIFITAYDEFAIRAIRYSALDYILKPVDVDELKAAVSKAEKKLSESSTETQNYQLLLSALRFRSRAGKIAVPTFDGLQMVKADEIIKCIADESYTHIFLADGSKMTVSRILKEFEDLLGELNFFRVHNSSLVNLAHVKKYIKGEGGYLLMSDGETVEVSRRKKQELLNRLAMVNL